MVPNNHWLEQAHYPGGQILVIAVTCAGGPTVLTEACGSATLSHEGGS
jgi:hypothetical protein